MSAGEELRGGCLCGAVAYRLLGPPRLVSHCHCSICRRASGAAFVTWVTLPAESFELQRGTLARYRSSDHGWRGFCAACGSPIASGSSRYPRYIEVTAGSLAEPGRVVPERHVFWPDHLGWLQAEDGLPRHVGDARSPLVGAR
jgi:hypothetical protein